MIRRTIDGLVDCSWELFCEAVIRYSPTSEQDSITFLQKTADLFGLPALAPVRVKSNR